MFNFKHVSNLNSCLLVCTRKRMIKALFQSLWCTKEAALLLWWEPQMLQAERTVSKSHLLVMRFRVYGVCAQLCGGLRAIVQCCIAVRSHTAFVSSLVSSQLCFNMLSQEVGWGRDSSFGLELLCSPSQLVFPFEDERWSWFH